LNALIVLAAIGGSTNAVIHLIAIAGRAGVTLTLDDFHEVSQRVPLLVDCKPAGSGYMEDLHRAGGVPSLLKTLQPLLHGECIGVTGGSLEERLRDVTGPAPWQSTIRPLSQPLGPTGGLAVVRGTLAPCGAVIKVAAATPALLTHRGPAIVFNSSEEAAQRLDDPTLNITPRHVMVLRNAGPVAAGMPESGSLPIPQYLARQGVRDMVRVSDARMSGTAYGTVVLHCAPEAAVGGPLALVRDGDEIELNVSERRIDLLVPETELKKRRREWKPPALPPRGWLRLHAEHVLQAHDGADLRFLVNTQVDRAPV
jgi:dihydroxy-acid dehydratase